MTIPECFDDMLDVWGDEEYPHVPEHKHTVTKDSELKFNGGNPVWLCGLYDSCRVIAGPAD